MMELAQQRHKTKWDEPKKGVAISAAETLGGLSNGVIRNGFFLPFRGASKTTAGFRGHGISRTERSKVFGGVQQRHYLGIRQQNSSGVLSSQFEAFPLSQQERKNIALCWPYSFVPSRENKTNKPRDIIIKVSPKVFQVKCLKRAKVWFPFS